MPLRNLSVTYVVFFAASTAVGGPLPCVMGSLQNYIDLGSTGCILEDKLLNNFQFANARQDSIVPAGITVDPLDTALNPGFSFGGPFMYTAGSTPAGSVRFLIAYTANVLAGGKSIDDMSAMSVNARVEGSGNNVTLFSTICLDAPFTSVLGMCPASEKTVTLLTDSLGTNITTGEVDFSPVNVAGILTELEVVAPASGSATIDSFAVRLSEEAVPEPGSCGLVLAGIFGLGWLSRSRVSKIRKGF